MDASSSSALASEEAHEHHPAGAVISPVHDFLAGTMAGVALTLVGHPFDTIKVRLQTHSSGVYRGGVDCLRQTISKEGFLAVYKGMSGPMLTIPLVNAIVFAAYGQAKDSLQKNQPGKPLDLWQLSVAGAYAGLFNSFVVGPVELVKTRLQIQHEAVSAAGSLLRGVRRGGSPSVTVKPEFNGPLDCIRKILATQGVRGLFRGMSATIVREVPCYGAQFFTYEFLKKSLTPKGQKPEDAPSLSPAVLIASGGVAGIAGWVASYPQDLIKSQLQAESLRNGGGTRFARHRWVPDGGFLACARENIARGGARALWVGFGTCVARAFPANAAGFLAYESALSFLQKREKAAAASRRGE